MKTKYLTHAEWEEILSRKPSLEQLEELLEGDTNTAIGTDNLALLRDLGVEKTTARIAAMVLGWFAVALHPADDHVVETGEGACPDCGGDVLISTTYRHRCEERCDHPWHANQGDKGQCRVCGQWYATHIDYGERLDDSTTYELRKIEYPEVR